MHYAPTEWWKRDPRTVDEIEDCKETIDYYLDLTNDPNRRSVIEKQDPSLTDTDIDYIVKEEKEILIKQLKRLSYLKRVRQSEINSQDRTECVVAVIKKAKENATEEKVIRKQDLIDFAKPYNRHANVAILGIPTLEAEGYTII